MKQNAFRSFNHLARSRGAITLCIEHSYDTASLHTKFDHKKLVRSLMNATFWLISTKLLLKIFLALSVMVELALPHLKLYDRSADKTPIPKNNLRSLLEKYMNFAQTTYMKFKRRF
jgi:hypothetical protein